MLWKASPGAEAVIQCQFDLCTSKALHAIPRYEEDLKNNAIKFNSLDKLNYWSLLKSGQNQADHGRRQGIQEETKSLFSLCSGGLELRVGLSRGVEKYQLAQLRSS